ncbi:[FeFe] hydrogenase H-cluster radical SAM maturase HydE [Candidatus Falkowbacteria bacterium]|nr:[FeFe] hydrogenase H-cluster radical SAM maturase HydE [Candidatus Falkowbacteria bacterium]
MCLTIPGKVIEIKDQNALLKTSSGVRQINIGLISRVKVGDWLLASIDLAVKKIKAKDAEEILELLSGKKITDTNNVSFKFREILKNAQIGDLTKEEIIYLLKTEGQEKEVLFSEADAVCKENLKDFICLHAIVEFSNYCANNCFYCGLRSENKTVVRYRMSISEIVKVANEAVNKIGYKMIVLQSGADMQYTDEMLVEIIKKIKAKSRCFIFMSVGERSVQCYKKMKKAGANGVLFRFETSNPKLYNILHPKNTLKGGLQNRLALLREIKKMGYYISSGPIIGLPGQTLEDLADDILMMKKLSVGMASMGPFIPCDGTPLAGESHGDVELSLKTIAASRLLIPKARIPVTTALETLDPQNARKRGLQSGANSLMFNLTPAKYRSKYKIYPNKFHGRDKDLEDFALYKGKESWEMLTREFKKYI